MQAADLVEQFLERSQIRFERIDETRLFAQMRGERKLTIPVAIAVSQDAVHIESFFMRKPMENEAAFYELLMRRNRRARGVHFALDGDGDVYLVGQLPSFAVDDATLDRVFGSLLVEADGMFDRAIEVGFASYLAADLSWRAKVAAATSPDIR